jgi:carboxylesterase
MNQWTVDPRAEPIRLQGDRGAVLLLHGLTGSPYSVKPLAEALGAAGYDVSVPLLMGHGTSPEALHHTRWNDWLMSARHAFDELAQAHEKVFVGGLSLGALLTIVLAQERGAKVAGAILMATPLHLDFLSQNVLRIARTIPIASVFPYKMKKGGPDVSDPAVAAAMPSYDRTPIAAAVSFLDGQDIARERAPRLSVPVLVQHGRQDHVAPARNAREVYSLLRAPHRRMIIYPRSWHILPLDVEHEQVQRDVLAFVDDPIGFASGVEESP